MKHSESAVDHCAFRIDIQTTEEVETACCGLLQELMAVHDLRLCHVRRDACQACVEHFAPTTEDINPVVAALLHRATERVVALGGVRGCDIDQARRLNHWAERNIPLVLPSEDDSGRSTHCACSQLATDQLPRIEQLLPKPQRKTGPTVRKWAVAVTTAPRRLPTLDNCLDSLIAAGWESPRLFIDSAVPVASRFSDLAVSMREPQIGAWPNYYLALLELLMRHPDADALLLVQDDALFFDHPQLRSYLEEVLWPETGPAIASLFCPSPYTQPDPGWYRFPADTPWAMGAVTFVFSREAAQLFAADPTVMMHRWRPGKEAVVDIDDVIGAWAHREKVPIFLPTPSLVQHVGHISTLWNTSRAVGVRRADRFAGDLIEPANRLHDPQG